MSGYDNMLNVMMCGGQNRKKELIINSNNTWTKNEYEDEDEDERPTPPIYIYTHTHTHIYIYVSGVVTADNSACVRAVFATMQCNIVILCCNIWYDIWYDIHMTLMPVHFLYLYVGLDAKDA